MTSRGGSDDAGLVPKVQVPREQGGLNTRRLRNEATRRPSRAATDERAQREEPSPCTLARGASIANSLLI
jgi:hypothetical protein